jgi:hypothetical protein
MQGFRVKEKMKTSGTQEPHGLCLWGSTRSGVALSFPCAGKQQNKIKKRPW